MRGAERKAKLSGLLLNTRANDGLMDTLLLAKVIGVCFLFWFASGR